MDNRQGLLNKSVRPLVAVILLSSLGSEALGQAIPEIPSLPGAATPGGVIPSLDDARRLRKELESGVPTAPEEKPRPPVPESNVRMRVEGFVLEGVVDRPDMGITLKDLQERVEKIREEHPKGMTISDLEKVTDELTRVYRSAGYILARAFIPEQEVFDGRVTLRILEGELEQLVIDGNKQYSSELIAVPFENLVGEPINQQEIERALLELNDYPGLRFNSVFSPGDTTGTAKLQLNVEKETRTEGTVWLDNHGTELTGEYRLWVEASLNNPTGVADKASAQVLTSMDDNDGTSNYYALSYQRPVYGPRNLLSLGFGSNTFDVGGDFKALGLSGESTTMNASLRRNFKRSRKMNVDGLVGLAMKSSSTSLSTLTIGEDALTVLTLSPAMDFRDGWGGYSQASLAYSLGLPDMLGSMGSDGDGKSSRTGSSGDRAGGDFSKININLARWQPLTFGPQTRNQSLLVRLQSQFSSDLLVSMEQMSLGGPNSVRAYPSSENMVDSGHFFSLEWIAEASKEPSQGRFFENLQFSVFYDYASGELNEPLANDEKSPTLQGYGASAQIAPEGKYIARLELAIPAGDPEPSNKRDVQYFFRFGYLF